MSLPVPPGSVLVKSGEECVGFFCPGCKTLHVIAVAGSKAWGWNGDFVRPTFTPSILVHSWESKDPKYRGQPRCHSFVADGQIKYCGDTEHALVNQTVPLPADPLAQYSASIT